MKLKIAAVTLITAAVIGGGIAGANYYNKKVLQEKDYLKDLIAFKEQKNNELRKKIKVLNEEKKKAEKTIIGENPDMQAITDILLEDAAKTPNIKVKEVTDIKISGDWATAVVVPEEKNHESQRYVLQKKNLKWDIIDMGTDLSQGDFPDSPAAIWQ